MKNRIGEAVQASRETVKFNLLFVEGFGELSGVLLEAIVYSYDRRGRFEISAYCTNKKIRIVNSIDLWMR